MAIVLIVSIDLTDLVHLVDFTVGSTISTIRSFMTHSFTDQEGRAIWHATSVIPTVTHLALETTLAMATLFTPPITSMALPTTRTSLPTRIEALTMVPAGMDR